MAEKDHYYGLFLQAQEKIKAASETFEVSPCCCYYWDMGTLLCSCIYNYLFLYILGFTVAFQLVIGIKTGAIF